MPAKKLMIVEDVRLFSDLLARTLSGIDGVAVVGIARDGETAIKLAAEKEPDAVLMDIELEGEMDGIEAATQIKAARAETGIVILSAHNDKRYVSSLPFGAGWGYLLKETAPDVETILRAIDATMNGMVMMDPTVLEGMKPRRDSLLSRLQARPLETLRFIAEGYDNTAIADKMGITVKSVEANVNIIYQSLNLSGEPGVHPRVRAALLFLEETEKR